MTGILFYVDVMAAASTATDTADVGVATTASVAEVVLAFDQPRRTSCVPIDEADCSGRGY